MAVWLLLFAISKIAAANGFIVTPSGPTMLMWQGLAVPVALASILIWGGFFPSPF